MKAERIELTELIHDTDLRYPLCLYVYDSNGYHRGGKWFGLPDIGEPRKEITTETARIAVAHGIVGGKEIRITNGMDFLVFHARDGKVLFPPEGADAFWRQVEEQNNGVR